MELRRVRWEDLGRTRWEDLWKDAVGWWRERWR